MKKTIGFILSIIMLLSIIIGIDCSAYALSSSGYCGTNVFYTFNSSTGKLIIEGTGAMTDYNNNNSPFDKQKSIKSIEINDGVTSIGNWAFTNCEGLLSVTLPSSLGRIGFFAFEGCNSLTDIIIPNSISNINEGIFKNCTSLSSITIPNSVTHISNSAFYNCTSLSNVTIPDKLTIIGNNAFFNCSSLQSITIPSGVTRIFEKTFANCVGLTNINIPNSVTIIENSAFIGCTGLTSITIPDSITNIGNFAFRGCTGLTSITVDSKNKVYDSRNNCNAIIEKSKNTLIQGCNNTVIPNSVTSIGDYAFEGCTGITSIEIPNSITSIGNSAFYGCTGLTSIEIPSSVTSIGSNAFNHCTGIISVTVDINNQIYDSRENCNAIIEKSKNTLIQGCKNTVIPDSVTSIGANSFSDCIGLKSITLPNSISIIKSNAFIGCIGLTSIEIPNSVTSIGNSAFYGCTGLTSIEIPSSVTSIGSNAFNHCTGITSVTVDINNQIYDSRENCNAIIEKSTNTLIYGCKNTAIPDSVTSIGDYAFEGCTGLTIIDIPDSVTSIVGYAFTKCSRLTSITIPDSVTRIGDGVFKDCTSLSSIIIPKSVTIIYYEAFDGCTELKDVYYKGSNDEWNSLLTGSDNTYLKNATIHYNYITPCDIHTPSVAVKENEIAATCIKQGSYDSVIYCSVCKAELSREKKYMVKKAHTVVNDAAVPATFKNTGKTAGSHCSVCKTVIVAQKPIAKLGAAKLSKVKPAKKKFTATWASVSGVDGYEIQYSLKKNMKKAKKKNITGAAKTKLVVKKLKAKKTYYVRIRAYKTINGVKVYSKWSAKKKVKIK